MLDAISCIYQGLRAVFEPIASGLWSRTQAAWNSISGIFSRRSAPIQLSRGTVATISVSQKTPTKEVGLRRFEFPQASSDRSLEERFRALQGPPLASRALEEAFQAAVDSVTPPQVQEARMLTMAQKIQRAAWDASGFFKGCLVKKIPHTEPSRFTQQTRLGTGEFLTLKSVFEEQYSNFSFCLDFLCNLTNPLNSAEFKQRVAIPFVVGRGRSSHIVTAFYDQERATLEFFNSKGYTVKETPGIDDFGRSCEAIFRLIINRFKPRTILENTDALQQDSYNCGVYVLDFIERRAQYETFASICQRDPLTMDQCTDRRGELHVKLRSKTSQEPISREAMASIEAIDEEEDTPRTAASFARG
jgi:hypothetical protein